MRRYENTTHRQHFFGHRFQIHIQGGYQQFFFLVYNIVKFIHRYLMSEQRGVVFYIGQMFVQVLLKFIQHLQIGEKSQAVYLFLCVNFASADDEQIILFTQLHAGFHIPGGVVVCNGNDVKPFFLRSLNDVSRAHLQIAAGRKACMNVKVGLEAAPYLHP